MTTLVSSAAMAQETEAASSSVKSGLEFTLGLGFQAGAGYVYKNGPRADGTIGDVKLSDVANGGIAGLLEIGYRASPNWFIGAQGQLTKVLTKNNPYSCPGTFECATTTIRLGPQVQYHFSPEASFDPFVGLGFGIVILNTTVEGDIAPAPGVTGSVDIDSQIRGPEFVNLTVGGKWRLSNSLSFGPYLTGTYARNTVRTGTTTTTVNIPPELGGGTRTTDLPAVDDGPYGYIILGVRGTFNL
ncbi:outer membrane beta-barrel protein [Pyxidicoccus xibeiensis]|uniref:outer membrane beta-barrel protein n=1 Tax=Pyxidicoccus xibeiensis TaxID=2906759 RepID=UPI0020A82D31|nr:outer membrane beta-barrel protein [Pyxidicoccus xibeiensis]MCP3140271.1 outer membrane beta-barrel protein [Pyxidicoccus xibeiensis]